MSCFSLLVCKAKVFFSFCDVLTAVYLLDLKDTHGYIRCQTITDYTIFKSIYSSEITTTAKHKIQNSLIICDIGSVYRTKKYSLNDPLENLDKLSLHEFAYNEGHKSEDKDHTFVPWKQNYLIPWENEEKT